MFCLLQIKPFISACLFCAETSLDQKYNLLYIVLIFVIIRTLSVFDIHISDKKQNCFSCQIAYVLLVQCAYIQVMPNFQAVKALLNKVCCDLMLASVHCALLMFCCLE